MFRQNISEGQIDGIKAYILKIQKILDFGVNLTPNERVILGKMVLKSIFYVLKVARNNPKIISVAFNINKLPKEVIIRKIYITHFKLFKQRNKYDRQAKTEIL